MSATSTLPPPARAAARPAGRRAGPRAGVRAGVRIGAVVHAAFTDPAEPLTTWDDELVRGMLALQGRSAELTSFTTGRGTSFATMSDVLLARLPGPLPELDAVLLAYAEPDLRHADVAGFALSERLPGAPVPCSLGEPGAGAAFTALRIADAMARVGELDRGAALFVYDQTATTAATPAATTAATTAATPGTTPAGARPDSAALLHLVGPASDTAGAVLAEVCDVRTGAGGAAAVLAALRARHPDAALLSADGPVGGWAALAGHWPLRRPVLLAGITPDPGGPTARVHSCLLVPDEVTP